MKNQTSIVSSILKSDLIKVATGIGMLVTFFALFFVGMVSIGVIAAIFGDASMPPQVVWRGFGACCLYLWVVSIVVRAKGNKGIIK